VSSSEPLALSVLKNQVATGRMATAYLFYGDAGSKKEELAQALARALLCTRREISWYCPCQTCERIAKGYHPDVLWLKRDEDTKGIKIEKVRKMIDWASLKPYEAEWKIAVLEEAERLTEEASQALLKTLEEPPQHTVFVLLTEDKSQILETIQSRVFGIRLNNPEAEEPAGAGPSGDLNETAWEQYLEKAAAYKREGVLDFLAGLLSFFHGQLRAAGQKNQGRSILPNLLHAVDAVYEARSAIEANSNAKLTLTWLAIQLNRLFPHTSSSKVLS